MYRDSENKKESTKGASLGVLVITQSCELNCMPYTLLIAQYGNSFD